MAKSKEDATEEGVQRAFLEWLCGVCGHDFTMLWPPVQRAMAAALSKWLDDNKAELVQAIAQSVGRQIAEGQ